jgi:hypothetical protein
MLEPSTTEGRRIHGELRRLLECVAVQQAESSASRLREPASSHQSGPSRFEREASMHPMHTRQRAPTVHDRLRDNRQPQAIHEHLGGRTRQRETFGYRPRRGGRYDSREDRSPSPEPPGPKFSARPSAGRHSRLGSELGLLSPNTRGRRSRSSGLLIIGSLASSGGGGGERLQPHN